MAATRVLGRAPALCLLLAGLGGLACGGRPPPTLRPVAEPAPRPRQALLDRLLGLSASERFLFGQQHATVWGMYWDGRVQATSARFEATARAGRFTSDAAAIVGDEPAVLGLSLEMVAFDPPSWNRKRLLAEAIRRHGARDGLVTLDWHLPSCAATIEPREVLAKVVVDDQPVDVLATRGGMLFYAEEDHRQPITSRRDVPESLRCVCNVVNDRPIAAGSYQGLSGRTWLRALARHAANVFRAEGLSELPIVVRPFHEHTGPWFWWGQPYWNCRALLGDPAAVSGPEAFRQLVRTFVTALRSEPGMGNLLFSYSADKLRNTGDRERFGPAERKLMDPSSVSRDLSRDRLVAELGALGLSYVSEAQAALPTSLDAVRPTPAEEDAYVARLRRHYGEAYPGDDVIDVLGMDLYYPMARKADERDLRGFGLQLRALAEEARARGKPHALTETGTYRLRLIELLRGRTPGAALRLAGRPHVTAAHDRLFHPEDRRALLEHFGLAAPGDVLLGEEDVSRLFGAGAYTEDWFNRQLLPLAKGSRVAYALVWQTYFDPSQTDRQAFHYVPYPGHPEAEGFRRFFADPATCFLGDGCRR
jgi:hypothetical protein